MKLQLLSGKRTNQVSQDFNDVSYISYDNGLQEPEMNLLQLINFFTTGRTVETASCNK